MNIKDLKVLICDDSILARKQLVDSLNSLGCTDIIQATNGKEAVEKYRAELPDLVFLDIIMPLKDGVTAVNEIISEYPYAKIIMVSSVGTKGELAACIRAGAKDFIQKPLNSNQLASVIGAVIERR